MKTSKKPLSLRILAGIGAAVLIALVLFVTNAFVGNPISAYRATRAIDTYVERNYSFLDLETQPARYNFKFGCYMATARSRTNPDIHFSIEARGGEVFYDGYAGYVLSGFNTLSRLGGEYAARAKALLQENLDYEIQKVQADYDAQHIENLDELIKPGMEFRKDLPIPVRMSVHTPIADPSPACLGQLFAEIHAAVQSGGYAVSEYSLYSENSSLLVMADGVTPADIESGNLERLLEQAARQPDSGHILLTIRDREK